MLSRTLTAAETLTSAETRGCHQAFSFVLESKQHVHCICVWQLPTASAYMHMLLLLLQLLWSLMNTTTYCQGDVVNGDKRQLKASCSCKVCACIHAPTIALPLQRCKRLLKHHYPYAAITDRLCRFAQACMRDPTSVRGALSVPMNAAKGSDSMEDPKPRPLRFFPTLVCNQIR